jgi:hypothetical protein
LPASTQRWAPTRWGINHILDFFKGTVSQLTVFLAFLFSVTLDSVILLFFFKRVFYLYCLWYLCPSILYWIWSFKS